MVRERGIVYVAVGLEAARSVERRLRKLDPRALREGRFHVAPEEAIPSSLRVLWGERPVVLVGGRGPGLRESAGAPPLPLPSIATPLRAAPLLAPGEGDPLGPVGRLAACVAHELNNPLDGCRRFLELALDPRTEQGEGREFLRHAKEGLGRMAEVVRELLAFARGAALETSEVDLHELLSQAAASVRGGTPARFVLGTAPGLARVPGGLFAVFTNLLRNALEATPPGMPVEVGLRRTRRGRFVVEIRDGGPGIPPAQMHRVFEPFYTTKANGTGLGLPIARHVARRHGARLLLRSRPGEGTVARLLLPPPREEERPPR
jgi:signal transduction histidine kinase